MQEPDFFDFNEAASRGQRIRTNRTNRKYPTRQRLRIVLRALPHHDHTRAVARLSSTLRALSPP